MSPSRIFRIGTRASPLAVWQAKFVAAAIEEHGHVTEVVEVTTQGDIDTDQPIESLGGTGIFTTAIEQSLLENHVDLAVHSLKDLPVKPTRGLTLAAVPVRADPADVLVARKAVVVASRRSSAAESRTQSAFDALPAGARVGTSSTRRRAQLLRARRDVIPLPIRGNIESRLRKLDRGEYDAIILAAAGLERLGLDDRITRRLPLAVMLPAAGQGALGVECRLDDLEVLAAARQIDDRNLHRAALAERSVLTALSAGCTAAVGALCCADRRGLSLRAVVYSPDGQRSIAESEVGPLEQPEDLGRRVADSLKAQGAAELLGHV